MPLFRIHALRDSLRQQFRAVPHVSGCAAVIGDLLETEDGQLRICKYVGFEPAQWVVPEPRPQPEPEAAPTT